MAFLDEVDKVFLTRDQATSIKFLNFWMFFLVMLVMMSPDQAALVTLVVVIMNCVLVQEPTKATTVSQALPLPPQEQGEDVTATTMVAAIHDDNNNDNNGSCVTDARNCDDTRVPVTAVPTTIPCQKETAKRYIMFDYNNSSSVDGMEIFQQAVQKDLDQILEHVNTVICRAEIPQYLDPDSIVGLMFDEQQCMYIFDMITFSLNDVSNRGHVALYVRSNTLSRNQILGTDDNSSTVNMAKLNVIAQCMHRTFNKKLNVLIQ